MTKENTRSVLERRWDELGFDSLLPEERDFLILWFLNTETFNGGLIQYFNNSSGDTALQALSALSAAGASQAHDILQQAISALDFVGGYTVDHDLRSDRLMSCDDPLKPNPAHRAVDALTDKYFEIAGWPECDFLETTLKRVQKVYDRKGIA